MDPRERIGDPEETFRAALDGFQAQLWTALPGIIQSFDAKAKTCTVQPAIKGKLRAPDGTLSSIAMPLLLDCPVYFPSGGGCTLTFPVAKGDECLVVFASRCIDSWWQSGGVQEQAEFRMHDLSDGFAFVGISSVPNVPGAISTSSTQLRSNDGSTVIDLNPAAKTMALTAPGGATINANTTINGTLHVTGAITSDSSMTAPTLTGTTDVVFGTVSSSKHKHGGVTTGSGISGGPQ